VTGGKALELQVRYADGCGSSGLTMHLSAKEGNVSNPNTWQSEQLEIHAYKSTSSTKARIIPTIDGQWRAELRLGSLDRLSPEEQTFTNLEDAKRYCTTVLQNRGLDKEV
jgi:hypothetical protein